MKKNKKNINIKYILIALISGIVLTFSSCNENNDSNQFNYDSELTNGAALKIVNLTSSSFELSMLNKKAVFSFNGLLVTKDYGENVKSVKVYTTFLDNTKTTGSPDLSVKTKSLVKEYKPADFTDGANGKNVNVSVLLTEALKAINLNFSDVSLTDSFEIYTNIELNDGRVFTSAEITNSLKGDGYKTPLVTTVPVI